MFDVLNTNDESVLPLKRRGLIARYVSPEATFYDDDLKDKEGYWHAAYVIPWFLGYNTKMVKKDELPKTYEELLNPKWKGRKIALGTDNGSLVLSGLIRVWGKEKAIRYFQQLAKQEPAIQAGAPSSRIQLARGRRISPDSRVGQYLANLRLSRRTGGLGAFGTGLCPVEYDHACGSVSSPQRNEAFYRLRAFQEGPGNDPVVSSSAGPHRCGRRAAANFQGIQKGGSGHRNRRQRRGNDEAL